MSDKIKNSKAGKIAGYYSLGQAAMASEISTQTLQYYLMCGLIEPANITQTNRKLFDNENIERIKLIKKLNESGYPLREIREIFLKGKQ